MDQYILPIATPHGSEPIAILQRSTGSHPIIAWHGISANNRSWFWDILWQRGAVHLAGLPGHGPLPPLPAAHYDRWDQQHFIRVGQAVVEQLAGGQPATLIGHSTGGMVALGVALAAPTLVARLILISPVVWGDLRGIVGLWTRLRHQPHLLRAAIAAAIVPAQQNYALHRQTLRAFIADPQGFYSNPRTAQAVNESRDDFRATPIAALAATARVIGDADLRSAVEAAPPAVPTLVIAGEQDGIVPAYQARWLAATLPRATLAVLPGVGHVPFAECEPEFNRAVLAWLGGLVPPL